MAQHALQVLGTVGIIETIVEFSYALVNLEDFTPFKRAFFVASGTCEMMGELYVLGVMIKVVLGQENAPDALNLAKQYVKDPIHIYAFSPWEGETGHNLVLETGAGWAIIVALTPTVFWWLALTIMVFGTGFVSDGDDDIMLALAIVPLCCFFFVSGVLYSLYVAGISLPKYLTEGYALLPCLYSVQKVFEVYLLLSRQDRLASNELGVSLIAFQLIELASCAMILVKYHIVRFFERRKARRVAQLPQPAASQQATQAQPATSQLIASPQQATSQQAGSSQQAASQQAAPSHQVASQPATTMQHITPQLVAAPQQASSQQVTPSPQQSSFQHVTPSPQSASRQVMLSQQAVSQPAAPPQHVILQLVAAPQQAASQQATQLQHVTSQLFPSPRQAAFQQVAPSQQTASQQATQSRQVASQPAAPPQQVTPQLVAAPQQVATPPVPSP